MLALELGRIVVRAVWVDEVCAALAVEYQRASGPVDRTKVTGESGQPLGRALREAGAAAWADEYDALYLRRNDVVHGLWSADADHRQMVRPTRGGAFAGAFTVRTWDANWLELLARDLDNFFDRARAEWFRRLGIPDRLTHGRPYE
ncbi:MAG: hypothetical protein BGO26_00025 [Actinobacteria bacterium 69-20]|jgi:hypothetical protein|nr:MAG: hypothetical protein BGO26_00025 [Actinobacteria bacterium 69-20]